VVAGFTPRGDVILVSGNPGGGRVREGVIQRHRIIAFVSVI
jgi:hypothetical protein